MASNDESNGLTNYVAYNSREAPRLSRIGHLDLESSTITPLNFKSGAPITDLYQVIEVGESYIKSSGHEISLQSVELLPPISGRDIMAVGKNYSEHAKEFNSSGYDSSDKVDQPTHPVIFTKRATSIIANGQEIYPHLGFSESVDFEGEIGVIIGKSGFKIKEADAMDHVWGYTIINDVTARERQRDHKQFFIGKSPDTFCPMGPIAVPASRLPKNLRLQTHVNGQKKQDATIDELIFSVPFLIQTISESITIRPGDVIATGTPAGVGIGQKPPVFLKSGDNVSISVTGLGVLSNTVSQADSTNYTVSRVAKETHIPTSNLSRTCGGVGLTDINSKKLYYKQMGDFTKPPIIFIHGFGASSEYYKPLISELSLTETHSLHLLDLEGQGLSPTSATSTITMSSYTADYLALASHANIRNATIIAHSAGCSIALHLAASNPELVSRLILIGPPPLTMSKAGSDWLFSHAASIRANGIASVVDAVIKADTSAATKASNHLAIAAIRMSILSQDPEGYAKGCTALAEAKDVDLSNVRASTLIIAGQEDNVASVKECEDLAGRISGAKVQVLEGVGHWHVFEDLVGVGKAVGSFLEEKGE